MSPLVAGSLDVFALSGGGTASYCLSTYEHESGGSVQWFEVGGLGILNAAGHANNAHGKAGLADS